ncbi:NAD(P)/FAD-dependent oxidoreductase [Amycolatopsis azurea]|uniref:FAD-dependent oxidoreductase n=1 Tax=Amycolatopsis azurea DSM 43854 TaxID=1238180 RepID=M2PX81_9PSEU|nr:FAD-binding oxidoreductase [Amycolatopsis azurea]EMD24240.1 putative sarcosine oxidase [Amycolatopsis azurea DSM 43854]OOC07942.1 FAD-dependent oxidoreductase [Amycolatopsis azurea DSM 43854]
MRVVLAGGGVIALLTAVECVSAGHEVVIADQADIPFTGATSFDRHRVLRALHPGDPATTAAAVGAHHAWIELEHLLSTAFYEQSGALTAIGADEATAARDLLNAAGSKAEVFGAGELAAEFPHAGFVPGTGAVFESHAGVLLADRVLTACAGWLRWNAKAELHPHRKVIGVDTDRAEVRLADGGSLRGDAVLLAAGPWSRDLLAPGLARELVLHRQTMLYCDVPPADAAAWAATPAITSLGSAGGAWLVPPVAGTPLKLSAASACRVVDEIGAATAPSWWREHLIDTFAELIPGFRRDWLIDTRDCHYLARRSTLGPMLAVLGDRVLSYAACGGSSFKFAPLIARSLTARLTGADPAPTGLEPLDRPLVRASGVHPIRPALRGVS